MKIRGQLHDNSCKKRGLKHRESRVIIPHTSFLIEDSSSLILTTMKNDFDYHENIF